MADPGSSRNEAIDWLRGVVMVLMALDHTRMFVGASVDLRTAPPALYFTRWMTHFCAPVFVLLAAMGAYLYGRRLASTAALSTYLLTRGLWLALLEVTVIRAAWLAYIGPDVLALQVIWVIGASMVVLAGLVWLPRVAIAAIAVALIAGFLVLRETNLYGDPHAWSAGESWTRTVLSFLDCEKYPPSLLFLAMTLGPALCVLALMDRPLGPWARASRSTAACHSSTTSCTSS